MVERTLIIIKPDGVQRHLIGEIIGRFERKGLKLVAARFMRVSEELARRMYSVHKGQSFYEAYVAFFTSCPVLVTVWEADGVIAIARKLMGATFGFDAEPGTIRGDLGCSNRYNLVHGSDSPESAQREIALFFKPAEIVEYKLGDEAWLYAKTD
ncbi:MAG TPA: nucleoside-diphosphate kinase [Sedimentisphaerales bacterium]|nr:nucleoside-diphosphate kinase [Sedimentisphaerales bacterium]